MADIIHIRLSNEQRIMLKKLCREQSSYYGRISITLYTHDDTARHNCIRLARFWKELEQTFHSQHDEPEPEPEEEGG